MQERSPKKEGLGPGALLMALAVGAIVLVVGWFSMNPPAAEDPKAKQAVAQAFGLVKQGKCADAEKLLEPFVASQECSAVDCKQTLASLYAMDGNVQDTERVCRSLGGNTDAGTADKMHFLGAPMAMYKPHRARPILERSAQLYKTLYGTASPQYAKDLYNIAICDFAMKKNELAADEFAKCIPLLETGYGPLAVITVEAKANLVSSREARHEANPQIESVQQK